MADVQFLRSLLVGLIAATLVTGGVAGALAMEARSQLTLQVASL